MFSGSIGRRLLSKNPQKFIELDGARIGSRVGLSPDQGTKKDL